jgi:hypothetical protein
VITSLSHPRRGHVRRSRFPEFQLRMPDDRPHMDLSRRGDPGRSEVEIRVTAFRDDEEARAVPI